MGIILIHCENSVFESKDHEPFSCVFSPHQVSECPKTNLAPEKWCLGDDFPFGSFSQFSGGLCS